MSTMLAAVYHGPGDLRVEQRPVPAIGPGEALLRVVSAGICATDLRILHGAHRKYPPGVQRIPGHEVVGDIVAVGAEVSGLDASRRVFVAPNMGCGRCRQCIAGQNNRCADYEAFGITLDGAFAQYMRIPPAAILQGNLIPLPGAVDPAAGALVEPFACVVRGQDAVGVGIGDLVLIVGAGPIGIMHLLLARLRGARRVIVSDLLAHRLAQAAEAGADRTVDAGRENLASVVAEESGGEGADVVVVAAPAHQAQAQALHLAGQGGRICLFGGLPRDRPTVEVDTNLVHYKELLVTGSTGCSTGDCRRAAALVEAGRVDLAPLVSARLPLSQAAEAVALAEDRRSLKVVLQPW